MTPITQPSSFGALSTSMSIEPDRKTEAIQRAQVGSLMGANRNNEPQNKSPKKQTPASGARPKKYALELWVEIETSAGVHITPEEDSYSVNFAIDCINRTYPGCTGMYLGMVGHMLAFYGKKNNPRAGLLLNQAITASKAIAKIPTWMGYFATWRVKCISTSKASEILAGCKRIEKESLRRARWELQQRFSTCRWTLPSLPPLNHFNLGSLRGHPKRMMCLGAPLLDVDWRGAVLLWILPLTLPGEGHFPVTTNPPMRMKGYPPIPPFQIDPPTGGMGVEGATAAIVAVTPMALTPLGVGVRKRMDFQVRSRYLSLEARRAILMMWLAPSSSGLTASCTIVITMRIHTSCP